MNIYDVAKLAGVSIATASKALNGRKDVREETRSRVLEVAKKLNYHPSHLARGLAKRRTENIGVIALRHYHQPFLTNPFYSRVVEGMEIEVTRQNYNMLLTVIPGEDNSQDLPLPKMVREKNVDGLCLVGQMPDSLLREVAARNIPTAVVDFYSDNVPGHYVVSDHGHGMRLAVDHLVELGHKRVAFINSTAGFWSFQEREKAFKESLSRAGMQSAGELVVDTDAKDAMDSVADFLKGPAKPTAVVCCNDYHAMMAMAAAGKVGLRVPDDLSVVGFDDIEQASTVAKPGLTTIRVEKQEMGSKAINIVMDLINHPDAKPKRVETPVHLVVRGSTSTAPRS